VFQLAPQDPGMTREKPGDRAPKARGSRRRRRRGGMVWGGVWEGCCGPSPENVFDFWAQKDDLWCILGAIFAFTWKLVRPLDSYDFKYQTI